MNFPLEISLPAKQSVVGCLGLKPTSLTSKRKQSGLVEDTCDRLLGYDRRISSDLV
jgi:hypothetical protein